MVETKDTAAGTETVRQPERIRLGIVTPMANERDTAVELVRAVLAQCSAFKEVRYFTVLDNKCKDGTIELLREYARSERRLCVVWAPENRCVVDAYVRGYREAVAAGCDWILEMDAGFSHKPEDMPKFFAKINEGYDCIFGSRFCPGARLSETPLKRKIISKGGTILTNLLVGTRLEDMTSGFELFSRRAMERVLEKGIMSKAHFFQTEIKTHCRVFKCVEVPIHYSAPSNSVNNKVLKDAFANLFRLFRLRITGQL
jgi:dolichol-phosphate mannosyltransferase